MILGKNSEINLYIYGQLIFNKISIKLHKGKIDSSIINGADTSGCPHSIQKDEVGSET